jgi:hypothetical protein
MLLRVRGLRIGVVALVIVVRWSGVRAGRTGRVGLRMGSKLGEHGEIGLLLLLLLRVAYGWSPLRWRCST